jgi:hypothetical protein
MMTVPACCSNIRDSIKLIPLFLAMWSLPAVLLQIQLPRSYLQGDLRAERALDGYICSWFLPPFLSRWIESISGCQTGSGDTICSCIAVFLPFCQEGGIWVCSSYLSYSPDTWPFFAETFSMYALLSTPYCNWMLICLYICHNLHSVGTSYTILGDHL